MTPRTGRSVFGLAVLLVGMLVLLTCAATAGARPPAGFYGVMWDRAAGAAPAELHDAQFALMRRNGVESIRTTFSWADVQPNAGQAPDFSATDRFVELAARHRLRVLPVVLYTPAWARAFPEPGATSMPTNPDDYARFLEQLIGRYGPNGSFWAARPDLPRRPIGEWQIWNEPHFVNYWVVGPQDSWAAQYVRLLNTAYSAIKRADPGAKVVLGALANDAWNSLGALYKTGQTPLFDVAAINLFTAQPGNVIRGVETVRRVLRRNGARTKPVWLTEATWPAGRGVSGEPPAESWRRITPVGMADRLGRFYALAARNQKRLRIKRVYWYTWASSYSGTDFFDYGGLLKWTGSQFVPQPALMAYRTVAR